MKKTFLAITALAAMLFAGCTSSDELTTLESIKTADNTPTPVQFGTYMGKGTTRAGAGGTITSDGAGNTHQLGSTNYEFGVFAYYTGSYTYGQQQGTTYTGETSAKSNIVPNFMYNQKVYLDGSDWKYSPLKYWPNDYSTSNVDDQSATGSTTYGGNVSFFAYAPYVASASGTNGITAITANNDAGDPKITYKLESDVDLLWGTANTSDVTATGGTNSGVTGDESATADTYKKVIVNGVTVNADLNKQKVNGQVKFLFKHALAAVGGGSAAGPGNGFQVKLDIDNSANGEVPASPAETGGERQDFNESATDYWRTKVTIKNISITNDLSDPLDSDADDTGEVALWRTGVLNLATGKWDGSDAGVVAQNISIASSYDATNIQLNTKLAEIKTAPSTTNFADYSSNVLGYFAKSLDTSLPGVTTTAQDVYNSDTQTPLMLIPGQTPKFRITVEYVVRQYDAALSSLYTEINNKISKIVTFPTIEMNKYYSLLMHLGLTSVKFTASVSNWTAGTIGDGNGDSTHDNDVYLPINVE